MDRLVEKLKALADGTTSIPMRLQFGEFTLNVISKVHVCRVCNVVNVPWYAYLLLFVQITFGSDFTQQFSEIERDHNILKEDFVVVVFKGLGLCLRFPGYQVRTQLRIIYIIMHTDSWISHFVLFYNYYDINMW